MEKSPKKFYIPENIEDSFDEILSSVSAVYYFWNLDACLKL